MKKLAYTALAFAAPLLVAAQDRVTDIDSVGHFITNIITNVAVPVIFALAFIVFIWGVFQYFIAGGHDEEKRKKGRELMMYGIIGFFVMVSVWGLVNILVNSVRLDEEPTDLPRAIEPR